MKLFNKTLLVTSLSFLFVLGGCTPIEEPSSIPASSSNSSSSELKTYTVLWVNDDGSLLEADYDVLEGSMPSYDGLTPIKSASAQYEYTFNGWTPELSVVTSNVTYTATYTSTTRSYTITWVNYDNSVLETDTDVPYGTTPTYDGETPTREGDNEHTYTFSGWSPEVGPVSGDTTYKATFTSDAKTYTIRWLNYDGSLLASNQFKYGDTPFYNGGYTS